MTLREVLHAHIPTLATDATVRDAVDKMDVYQFPALVIVDEARAPVAVVTEGDLCRAAQMADGLARLATTPALVHATREPVVAHPDEEIGDAFHRMLASGLTVLPVVEDAVLSGVVFRVDLMHAMILDAL